MNFFHVISSAEFPGLASITINVRTDDDSITIYFDGDQAAEKLKGKFLNKSFDCVRILTQYRTGEQKLWQTIL